MEDFLIKAFVVLAVWALFAYLERFFDKRDGKTDRKRKK